MSQTSFHSTQTEKSQGSTKVEIETKAFRVVSFDGAVLAGECASVRGTTVRTLLVCVHGSFPQDRSGSIAESPLFPHKPPARQIFLDVQRALLCASKSEKTQQVSIVRYDKRAAGASEGSVAHTDLHALADDLRAVVTWARKHVPTASIGVLGQSEGTLTALAALARHTSESESPLFDYFVSSGGALQSFRSIVEWQKTRAAAPFLVAVAADDASKTAVNARAVQRAQPFLTALYRSFFCQSGESNGQAGQLAKAISDPSHGSQFVLQLGEANHELQCDTVVLNVDLYRQYELIDCEKLLLDFAKDHAVLLLQGRLDKNCPIETVEALAANNSQLQHVILDDCEHSFRQVRPGDTFIDVMSRAIDERYGNALVQFFEDQVLSQ